jgi:hypothetical protein
MVKIPEILAKQWAKKEGLFAHHLKEGHFSQETLATESVD